MIPGRRTPHSLLRPRGGTGPRPAATPALTPRPMVRRKAARIAPGGTTMLLATPPRSRRTTGHWTCFHRTLPLCLRRVASLLRRPVPPSRCAPPVPSTTCAIAKLAPAPTVCPAMTATPAPARMRPCEASPRPPVLSPKCRRATQSPSAAAVFGSAAPDTSPMPTAPRRPAATFATTRHPGAMVRSLCPSSRSMAARPAEP